MLAYYKELKTFDGLILSCDMLRLKFKIHKNQVEIFDRFIRQYAINNNHIDLMSYNSFTFMHYKYLYTLTSILDKTSFSIGLCQNGCNKEQCSNCFIEFNPNKTYSNGLVVTCLEFIKHNSYNLELSRFDFAIDIPTARANVCLLKDKRNYSKTYKIDVLSNNLNNITEYLGTRNSNGFVKLYNKTIESNLSYELTRLEITLDSYSYDNFIKSMPDISYYKNSDLFELNTLNDTDKVLLALLRDNPNSNIYLKMLGRVKYEKFSKLLFSDKIVKVSEIDFYNIVCNIKTILS